MLHTEYFPIESPLAPPVVLIHGFAASADEDFLGTGWAAELNSTGRSVIAVDLPGHGKSPAVSAPAEAATSAVLQAIVDAVSQHVPSSEFDVIGYSLGARIAWDLPRVSDRVRRVVLGGLSPMEPFAAVAPEALEAVLGGSEPDNPLVGFMAMMISAPGRDTASLAHVIQGLASEPFTPEAGGPQVPALLVAGDEDQMTQGIEGLAAGLPHAQLAQVPGDHRGALDSAEFRAEAVAFLSE